MSQLNDFLTFAVKAYGMTEAEVTELLTEKSGDEIVLKNNANDILLDLDAKKVGKLKNAGKDELTAMHEKGYNKAKAEVMGDFEKQFMGATGFHSDKKGVDLVMAWGESLKQQAGVADIKLNPEYLKLEKKLQSEFVPKEQYDKLLGEFDDYKVGEQRNRVLSRVKQDALKVFRSLNPVLDEDPIVAMNRENDFLEKLSSYNYEVGESENDHIVKKGDHRLETPNGYPVPFADHIRQEAAKYFTFRKQEDKGSAGAGRSGSGTTTGKMPKDKSEYLVMLANATTPEEKIKLLEYYKQHLNK